jgi:hypothetical protein
MANAHMPEEFFETIAHHLPPEQPVGPKGRRPRVGHRVVIWINVEERAGARPAS